MDKILVVVPDLKLGGVTSATINFCNELIVRGNKVDLLNMDGDIIPRELNLNSKIKLITIDGNAQYWNLRMCDVKQVRYRMKIKLLFWGVIKKVTNHMGKWWDFIFGKYKLQEYYDVVVAFRQCAPCYYFVLNCTRAKKKIAFVHGDIDYMGDISSWDCYLGKFDYIACVSNAVRKGFAERYNSFSSKFRTVYNMLDKNVIKEKVTEQCATAVDSNLINIITIARNENNHKQVDWIPIVCKRLKQDGIKNFHWYIVGDGPDLKSNVELTKKLDVEDVLSFCGASWNPYPLLRKCDFLVLPSKTESYGLVVVEAHILKKPVVATRYSALTEVMEDGITGIIAEQNIYDLVKKIKSLIKNENDILSRLKKNLETYKVTNDVPYWQFVNMYKSETKEEK